MPKIKKISRPMTPMDCYHKLFLLDLRGKSKFRNGEYQYLLRIAAHTLSNFVNSHLGPISCTTCRVMASALDEVEFALIRVF